MRRGTCGALPCPNLMTTRVADLFRSFGMHQYPCVLAAVLGLAFTLPQQARAAESVKDKHFASLPIIDMHAYFIGYLAPGEFRKAAANAVSLMDRFNIVRSIVQPPPQIDAQLRYDFTRLQRATAPYGNRFIILGGGAWLNAMLHRHADPGSVSAAVRASFRRQANSIIDAGAKGFGEISGLHISARERHPYEFVPADHPLLRLLADIAALRDVPVDLHMDALDKPSPPPGRFSRGNNPAVLPETINGLVRLLEHNRRARIVWAHGGSDPLGGMSAARINALMDAHRNLFVSLRIVGGRAPMFNKLLANRVVVPEWLTLLKRHASRFVIGTDTFHAGSLRKGRGPGYIFASRNERKLRATRHLLSLLPLPLARKVAYENAIRIYRLAPL